MEPPCISRMDLGFDELTRCKGLLLCHTEELDACGGWLCVSFLSIHTDRDEKLVSIRTLNRFEGGETQREEQGDFSNNSGRWKRSNCYGRPGLSYCFSFVPLLIERPMCIVLCDCMIVCLIFACSIPFRGCFADEFRFCGIIDVYCSVGWQGRLNGGKIKSYCTVQFHCHALLPTSLKGGIEP